MAPKAVAAAIVIAIGAIASLVLYSPTTTRSPVPSAPATRAAQPLPAPVLPGRVPEPPPHPPSTPRRSVAGIALPGVAATAPPASVRILELPVGDDVPPVPLAATPLAAVSPLAERQGSIPERGTAPASRRGTMRVAGDSIGDAFIVAGRGLRAAFRRTF